MRSSFTLTYRNPAYPPAVVRFVAPSIERRARPGGGVILASRAPLPACHRSLGDALVAGAARHPERALFAERGADGAWTRVSWAEALAATRALGQALLDLGL